MLVFLIARTCIGFCINLMFYVKRYLYFFTLRAWSKSCDSLFLYLESLKQKLCFFVSSSWEPGAKVVFLCFFTLRAWSKSCVSLFLYLESLEQKLGFFVSLPSEPEAKIVFVCFFTLRAWSKSCVSLFSFWLKTRIGLPELPTADKSDNRHLRKQTMQWAG